MKIDLVRARASDSEAIHRIQVLSFAELYERYQDHDSNPANKTVEQVAVRIAAPDMDSYFIRRDYVNIGALRVIREPDQVYKLTSICILPEYQGCGYAQKAILLAEELYPKAVMWILQTIKQEEALCYLYERLSYRATGEERDLQPGMTLASYEKNMSARA